MSRVAKAPVAIPAGVEVKLDGQVISIKGKNGELTRTLNKAVEVKHADNTLTLPARRFCGWLGAGWYFTRSAERYGYRCYRRLH